MDLKLISYRFLKELKLLTVLIQFPFLVTTVLLVILRDWCGILHFKSESPTLTERVQDFMKTVLLLIYTILRMIA